MSADAGLLVVHNWPPLNSIASYEKNEQVQQANVFKRHIIVSFSTYRRNSFKHLSHM